MYGGVGRDRNDTAPPGAVRSEARNMLAVAAREIGAGSRRQITWG